MNTMSAACLLVLVATSSCALVHDDVGSNSAAASPKPAASTLTLSVTSSTKTTLTLRVCAGATGSLGGFTLHWLESSLLPLDGKWPSEETDGYCDGGFSGNAKDSRFDLAAYECATLEIGALTPENGASYSCNTPLECGTEYAFRAFAHGGPEYRRGEWSATLLASTSSCSNGCTYSQGYWKNHTPFATKTALWTAWPVAFTQLGSITYSNSQVVQILGTPVSGNGLVSLAHQLAAAKLNIAAGASDAAVASAIANADTLIGSRVVPSVGSGFLAPSATGALTTTLTQFNEGTIGPGHCVEGAPVP